MSLTSRRVARVAALSGALLAAFAGGVVAGVAGSDGPDAGHRQEVGVIDEAADRIQTRAARAVERDQLERAAVEGMLQSLGDRWSSFYRPSEFDSFQAALDGRYSGVGLWLRRTPDGRIEVSSVGGSSPAGRAGLRTGDDLLAIGGRQVDRLTVGDVVQMLRGTPGSTVTLRYVREATVKSVTLVRTTLSTDDVTIDHLRGRVLRIRIAAFTRGVGEQVRDALDQDPVDRSGGVILDLRDDPGGLLDEAVEVASALLDGGPVVSYERRGEGRRVMDAAARGDSTTPLAVLIDSGTASAAEIVAGALQDRNRAVLVGCRTFGKGSVQESTKLSDGSAIELTVGRFYTPSGRAIDGVGLEPDVLIDSDQPPAVAERRALEVLSGLVAALGTNGRG